MFSRRMRLLLIVPILWIVSPAASRAQAPPKPLPTPQAPGKSLPLVLWYDQFPDKLVQEMAIAAKLGVRPIRITGPGSPAGLAEGGRVFKWVISAEGELLCLPVILPDDPIKHSVATAGRPVIAAGEARFHDDELLIDNHSSHYQPKPFSLDIAKPKFEALGFKVRVIDKVRHEDETTKPRAALETKAGPGMLTTRQHRPDV